MITLDNYFEIMDTVDITLLPDYFQDCHATLIATTEHGTNWNVYKSMIDEIGDGIDKYIVQLNIYILMAIQVDELKYFLNGFSPRS